nr:immunoglobulin light chain junction region [Macaca mulatta]
CMQALEFPPFIF